MRAAYCTGYGSPEKIELRDMVRPSVKPNEVLIGVKATAVNSADARTRSLSAPTWMKLPMRLILGWNRPRQPVLGNVFAGEIVECGQNVTHWKVGDRVYGSTGGFNFGAHAEYLAINANGLFVIMPKKAGYEDAVSIVFGGLAALWFIDLMQPSPGQSMLVYGASGAVGSLAVQIGRAMGLHVTAVASEGNRQSMHELGIGQFIDYQTQPIEEVTERFDFVFDAVGKLKSAQGKRLLKPGGRFQTVGGLGVAKELPDQLHRLTQWFCAGKIKPVIDRIYSLDEVVEAHRYVDLGHKRGSVVLRLAE